MQQTDSINSDVLSEIKSYAANLIKRRDYSVASMRVKLEQRGYENDAIYHVIEYLIDNDWLNDQRFAQCWCAHRLRSCMGPLKIRHELVAKGISHDIIESVYADIVPQQWQKAANNALILRFARASDITSEIDLKQKGAMQRFLKQRGFLVDQVMLAITQLSNK